jgi:hypothetical protein
MMLPAALLGRHLLCRRWKVGHVRLFTAGVVEARRHQRPQQRMGDRVLMLRGHIPLDMPIHIPARQVRA